MTAIGNRVQCPGILVRQVTPKDARVTLPLMERLLDETPFMLRKPEELIDTLSDEARFLQNIRASGNSAVFLALAEDRGVGLLVATGGALLRLRHVVYMGMGVLSSHWSRGIGGARPGRTCAEMPLEWANRRRSPLVPEFSWTHSSPTRQAF